MPSATFKQRDFLRFLAGPAIIGMLAMILLQELGSATSTWLVIRIAREITQERLSVGDFGWIVVAQTISYLAGTFSWIFGERAGFGAYSRYMLYFARQNLARTALLGDTEARERTEPFLTSETFHVCFELIYTVQFHLRVFFQLLFNLGIEIDGGLPAAFTVAFLVLAGLQWFLRKPLADSYLNNQRMTNRMTARTYNAWDNVFSGNRYNFSFWHRDFRQRLADALSAQVRAIVLREGWSAASGVIALLLVLGATAGIALADRGNLPLLIALAATLPRQIEMTLDLHQLTIGFTDLLAVWTRIKGICEHMRPIPDTRFLDRIDFDHIVLRAGNHEHTCTSLAAGVHCALARPTGLLTVRGGNGSGKSTLLAALKAQLRGKAFYWPTQDRMVFSFNSGGLLAPTVTDDAHESADGAEALSAAEEAAQRKGYSSGERQLQVLREIVAHTDAPVYLLDEWDANLDMANRAIAMELVNELAHRARVIEISHRDNIRH